MKLLGLCFPPHIWVERDPVTNVSSWRGSGFWALLDLFKMLRISKEEIEIVTQLSKSTVTHPGIQTVADGAVDLATINIGVTSSRFAFIDYTIPLHYGEVLIASKKESDFVTGNFFSQIFDGITMGLIALAIVVTTSLVRAVHPRQSFVSILVYSFGAALTQGFPRRFTGNLKLPLGLFVGLAFILTTSYSGLIVAKLLARGKPQDINSLEDLTTFAQDKKMILQPKSLMQDFIMSSSYSEAMAPRIEERKYQGEEFEFAVKVLEDIQSGSYVVVDTTKNLEFYIEASKSRGFTMDMFHFSPPLYNSPTAWIFPKEKSELPKLIHEKAVWLMDLGLKKRYEEGITKKMFEGLGGINFQENYTRVSCNRYPIDLRNDPANPQAQEIRVKSQDRRRSNDRTLKLSHFQLLFAFLVAANSLAAFTFFAELVLARILNKKGGTIQISTFNNT